MPNLTEITQFCRLCLVKNNVNIPIFEDQSENGQIFVKISSCLPVTVTRDDDLPKNICSECANKLDVAYEFRKSTVVAEKQLRQWIDDINIKNLNDSSKEADDNQIIKEEPDDSFVAIPETITYESDKGSSSKTRKSGGSEPPPKRARRAAAMKRPVNIPSESDEDVDDVEPLLTKTEDSDSELDTEDHDPTFEDIPPTNVDQPGPSGVGKEGVESRKSKRGRKKKKKQPTPQQPVATTSKVSVQLTKLNIEQLKLQLPDNHLKDLADKFKCLVCKVFLKDHFKDGEYKCCKCNGEKLYSRFKLARHGYHFHYLNKTDPLDMIKCKECPELFERLIDMKRHMLENHKKDAKDKKKSNKNKTNDGEESEEVDQETDDDNSMELTCDLCYDEFESKEELDEHMELHERLAEEEVKETEDEESENSPEEDEEQEDDESLTGSENKKGKTSTNKGNDDNSDNESNLEEFTEAKPDIVVLHNNLEDVDSNAESNASNNNSNVNKDVLNMKRENLEASNVIDDDENTPDNALVQMPLITNVETVADSNAENKNRTVCVYCNKNFEKEQALIKHKKRYLNCLKCEAFTTCNATKIRSHYTNDHNLEYCVSCLYLSNSKDDWNNHLDNIHKCKSCMTVHMKGKCPCQDKAPNEN